MPEFRALDALTDTHPPLLRKRQPYWRPKTPTIAKECRIPSWTWEREGMGAISERIILDVNGAFMAPLSGTELAHGQLEQTGADVSTYKPAPGYYRIEAHGWSDPRIVNPLGLTPIPPTPRHRIPLVWVAAPTVDLLHAISDAGFWPGVTVHDSWTSPDRCRASAWATHVREERALALLAGDTDRQEAVKLGYSQAIQMMLGPKEGDPVKGSVIRPDWNHAIRAQHMANMWRKAWGCVLAGIPILGMQKRDEITLAEADFADWLEFAMQPKSPVKWDDSGMQLGAFKIKRPEDDR